MKSPPEQEKKRMTALCGWVYYFMYTTTVDERLVIAKRERYDQPLSWYQAHPIRHLRHILPRRRSLRRKHQAHDCPCLHLPAWDPVHCQLFLPQTTHLGIITWLYGVLLRYFGRLCRFNSIFVVVRWLVHREDRRLQ
jgi:hypothetical protein